MKIFIGIDGGGTKTEALACTEDGVILGHGVMGPSNPLFVGKDKAFEMISDSLKKACESCDVSENAEYYAAVCIPAIKTFENALNREVLNFCIHTNVDADEMNAFLGALAKPYGVIVLGGTGSFAMGIDKAGQRLDMGGWGPVLGDEGSGYYIGLSALKAMIREYEGTGPATSLTQKIKELFHINDVTELRRIVYSKDFGRNDFGSLGKIVETAAREGDAVSRSITDQTANELADLAVRTINKLDLDDENCNVALTGGVRKFGDLILKPFAARLQKECKHIVVKDPEFVPVVGSLMIAMRDSGIDFMNEKIIMNLKNSYQKYQANESRN